MRPQNLLKRESVLTLLLPILCLLAAGSNAGQAAKGTSRTEIPEATKPCTPEEAEWWKALRAAGTATVAAYNKGASSKGSAKLNSDIAAAKATYLRLLREGILKSYRAPVPDGAPIILYRTRAQYTPEARNKRISGVVTLSVELRADGLIGEVKVVKGLGGGLDEGSIEAARQILFLPRIKDGAFATVRSSVSFSFNIQ